jgi:hypothetical protein
MARKRTTVELLTARLTRDLHLLGPTAAETVTVPAGTIVIIEDPDRFYSYPGISSTGVWAPAGDQLLLVVVGRADLAPLRSHLHTAFALNREDVSFALSNPR